MFVCQSGFRQKRHVYYQLLVWAPCLLLSLCHPGFSEESSLKGKPATWVPKSASGSLRKKKSNEEQQSMQSLLTLLEPISIQVQTRLFEQSEAFEFCKEVVPAVTYSVKILPKQPVGFYEFGEP